MRGVNGIPSLIVKIPPNCQPLATAFSSGSDELVFGSCQMPEATATLPTLKSDNPRLRLPMESVEVEFWNCVGKMLDEDPSTLFCQVKAPCNSKPCLNCCCKRIWSEL